MILIFSEEGDYSTHNVLDWLFFYNQKVRRINSNDLKKITINVGKSLLDCEFVIGAEVIKLDEIRSFWYRRGSFEFNSFFSALNLPKNPFGRKVKFHLLQDELKTVEEFIIFQLHQKNSLGDYFQRDANELISLSLAREIGLEIPETIISTSKTELVSFFDKHKNVITKGLQDILSFLDEDYSYFTQTEKVRRIEIENMSNSFFPSKLQKNVPKLYELRIFFIRGSFYSMAIFSQKNKQTSVDFRNYSESSPSRTVRYELPLRIRIKLSKFMDKMQLDTGSIDMIVTPKREYVFLEVNPVGQYGMTSNPCNFHLDKIIAKELMKHEA